MRERKYVYRLPPCPAYDIEGTESWLEDLAKEGLMLEKESRFFGFFTFSRSAPQAVRYRLEAALKTQSFWDGDPGEPKDEAVSISRELGWEYVVKYEDFFIYRSFDPTVPELNTDPAVHALALGALKKRQRNALLSEIVLLALFLFLGMLSFLSYPMGMAVAMGTPIMLAVYGFFLWNLIRPLVQIYYLRNLQKRILSGEPLNRKKNWRSGSTLRRILKPVPTVLGLAVILASCGSSLRSITNEIPLSDYSGDPPFVTIADLSPEGAYTQLWEDRNTVEPWSDWLFPVNYSWFEYSEVTAPDGTTLSGTLDVSYHEALTPAIARQLADELIRYAASGKYFDEIMPVDLGTGPVSVYTYSGHYGIPTVLLVYENIVIEAQVSVDDADRNSAAELWIRLMTQMLTAP